MLSELTGEQRALAEQMSATSVEAYATSWMPNLEFGLWEALLGRRRQYGRTTLGDPLIATLRSLSQACAGWIVFSAAREEAWIPMAEWEKRFEAGPPSSKNPGAEVHSVTCECGGRFEIPFGRISMVDVMKTQEPIDESVARFRTLAAGERVGWLRDLLGTPSAPDLDEAAMLVEIVLHHRRSLARGGESTCPLCDRPAAAPLHPVYVSPATRLASGGG